MRQIVFVLCLVITATSVITSQGNGVGGELDRAAVAALLNGARNNPPYVPGELIVQFRAGTTSTQQNSVLRLLRSAPSTTESIGTAVLLSGLTGEEPEAAAAALARQPEVLFAQPNYIRKFLSIPNDPGYSLQWHMDAINMPLAWEINSSAASGVTVGVVDSGLTTAQGTSTFSLWTGSSFGLFTVPFARAADFDHTRVKTGAEFTVFSPEGGWRSSTGQPLFFDSDGHGTHVAGTITQQTDNREGFAGVAHGATLLPVKVCFGPWEMQMLAGLIGEPGFFEEQGCADADIARGIRYAHCAKATFQRTAD
jgi:serine protease